MLIFCGGRKPDNPEKNPWSKARTNNKLNPHETERTGIEPGLRGGRHVLIHFANHASSKLAADNGQTFAVDRSKWPKVVKSPVKEDEEGGLAAYQKGRKRRHTLATSPSYIYR